MWGGIGGCGIAGRFRGPWGVQGPVGGCRGLGRVWGAAGGFRGLCVGCRGLGGGIGAGGGGTSSPKGAADPLGIPQGSPQRGSPCVGLRLLVGWPVGSPRPSWAPLTSLTSHPDPQVLFHPLEGGTFWPRLLAGASAVAPFCHLGTFPPERGGGNEIMERTKAPPPPEEEEEGKSAAA